MEPQIRYARTTDGVNIAWFAIGSGAPYVWPATPLGAGLIDAWSVPEWRELVERVASRARLILYDPRGFGLSDHGDMDYSLDAMVRDLEAVADAATTAPFILQSFSHMSIPCIVYAARQPARVAAMVLLNGVLRGADMSESWQRLVRLAAEDWETARMLFVRTNEAAYDSMATLAQFEQLPESGAKKDAFLAFADVMATWDASDIAGSVETPAIVVHYGAQSSSTPAEASRRLAASLPRGTFALLGRGTAGERMVDRASDAVSSFLREVLPRAPRRAAPATAGTGTAVILFTDIAESAALTERLGDAAFRDASRTLDDGIRAAIREAGGTPLSGKVLGDGVMGVFAAASQAIGAARACVALSTHAELPLHVGLHAGDVISEADNVYGGAVNIASRICGLCEPGEILVSQTVRDLARTSAGVTFEDRGEHALKGIVDPVRVFAVRGQPAA